MENIAMTTKTLMTTPSNPMTMLAASADAAGTSHVTRGSLAETHRLAALGTGAGAVGFCAEGSGIAPLAAVSVESGPHALYAQAARLAEVALGLRPLAAFARRMRPTPRFSPPRPLQV